MDKNFIERNPLSDGTHGLNCTIISKKISILIQMVDATINRVMAGFKPRMGQMVKTQELWQKVVLDFRMSTIR